MLFAAWISGCGAQALYNSTSLTVSDVVASRSNLVRLMLQSVDTSQHHSPCLCRKCSNMLTSEIAWLCQQMYKVPSSNLSMTVMFYAGGPALTEPAYNAAFNCCADIL